MKSRIRVVAMSMVALSAWAATVEAQRAQGQTARPPNVVLIMMDDLGYGDLGSYGARDVRTPNIDQLARQGVRSTDAYSNGQVCTPTRAALISGRYPQRFGLERALTAAPADTVLGLPVTGTSLPALLESNGYATGLIGKWHLGFIRSFSPQAHGFDEFFGFLAGAHDYYLGNVIQGVEKILRLLEQRGLTANTLVIFTNDNGGEWLSRNAPFFHRKATLWEGGIRVPLIMRWPGVLPAGKTSPQVAATMDLTATVLAATRTTPPASYRPDGIDLTPMLRGDTPVRDRDVFWRIPPPRNQRAVRSGNWKLLFDGAQVLLFDLATDPGERNDLAARQPGKVATLKRLYLAWESALTQEGR